MAMPIYLAGSISGGRGDVELYVRIADALTLHGFDVERGEVTNRSIGSAGEQLEDGEIYARDVAAITRIARAGGAIVAEVTQPSLGVGYEIGLGLHEHAMPVVCLFRPAAYARCSAMLAGNPGLHLLRYSEETLQDAIDQVAAILTKTRE